MGPLTDPPEALRALVRDGRITVMPAKRTRRFLLLDQVTQAFEPGRHYPEQAVDEILKPLRRHPIDEDLMSRTPGGHYWRSGGSCEPGGRYA